METLYTDGIRESKKLTTDKDARRLAVKMTDEFFETRGMEFKINDLMGVAWDYEQMIYHSAKKLKLICDPIEVEINASENNRRLRGKGHKEINPLRLTSESVLGNYKGIFVNIKPLEENNGIQKAEDRESVGRISGDRAADVSKI